MIERPLMTPDELKSLPKGTFIVTKTGFYPIKVRLKLFFEWGIEFEKQPYVVPLRDNSRIQYADKQRLQESIENKYPKHKETETDPESDLPSNATRISQEMTENHFNPQKKNEDADDREGGGENSFTIKMSKRPTGGE
jgi:type IV secretion system protein VirD4